MCKSKMIFLVLAVLFFACKNEAPEQTQPAEVQPVQETPSADAPPIEQIRARAIDVNDRVGRVRSTLGVLQRNYNEASGQMKGLGKVTVSVDEDFNLRIENDADGEITKTEVNLKHLNPEEGGMRLLPDLQPGEHPGLRIFVLDGKPGVSVYKNGKLEKEERQLDIYLPQRHHIERIAPALTSVLNVVHGKVE